MTERGWKSTPVIAWTEREGPPAAPQGAAQWTWFAAAGTLGTVFSVMFMTDALCPEHRVWVQSLAAVALVGTIATITGLVRGWSSAPLLAVAVGLLGAAIGVIDAEHAPVRGGAIAAGFLLAVLFGIWLTVRQYPLRVWDRRLRRESAFVGDETMLDTAPIVHASRDPRTEPERARTRD